MNIHGTPPATSSPVPTIVPVVSLFRGSGPTPIFGGVGTGEGGGRKRGEFAGDGDPPDFWDVILLTFPSVVEGNYVGGVWG